MRAMFPTMFHQATRVPIDLGTAFAFEDLGLSFLLLDDRSRERHRSRIRRGTVTGHRTCQTARHIGVRSERRRGGD